MVYDQITMTQTLTQALFATLKQLQIPFTGTIEVDSHPTQGDYSSNVAMKAFSSVDKQIWRSPRDLAQAIVEKLQQNMPTYLEDVSVAGPGFINFYTSNSYLCQKTAEIATQATPLIQTPNSGKRVIVEFSSPNIAKPFTIGHLRSSIIGNSIANLLQATGWTVYKDNHLGDWGTQFGKLIYAIKTWGDLAAIEQSDRPVKELVALYIKFHEEAEKNPAIEEQGRYWFTQLEQGNAEARALWQKCVNWSLKEFQAIYAQLGIVFSPEFDNGKGWGESFFEGMMSDIIKELEDSSLLQEGEQGSKLVFFPGTELPPLMIVKKDGSTLYATRDLAADKYRLKVFGQDTTIINEVGIEQQLYFQQLYKTEELLGWVTPGQRIHVKHGHFRFHDQKMSTRKGNVIWLEDVILEATSRARALITRKQQPQATDSFDAQTTVVSSMKTDDVTETTPNANAIDALASQVGVGALKWNDLKRTSHLDVIFDWDDILSLEGNCGPYIQYTTVRCTSVLRKAGTPVVTSIQQQKLSDSERNVAIVLSKFDEVIQNASQQLAPHLLCTYLYELSQAFNSFYNQEMILKATPARDFRLQLTSAVAIVLSKGLSVLGISVPEQM